MTRPKPKKLPKTLAPWEDPASPDYISPREDRRMRRELFRRVELLFAIADAKGYAPPKSPPSSPDMIEGPSATQSAKQHPTVRVGSGGPEGPTIAGH